MDNTFYKKVYNIINGNILHVKKFLGPFLSIKKPDVLENFLQSLNQSDYKGFKDFIRQFSFNMNMGYGWNEPVFLQLDVPDDLAEFILEGEFVQHCKDNKRFDDTAMHKINIDICNRFYTLLCLGLL